MPKDSSTPKGSNFSDFLKKKFLELKVRYLNSLTYRSYAQEGEDLVLRRFFEGQSKGFYVDIGAFHPKLFSNTYFFYKRGWRGINIDAMPGSMKAFNLLRKKDINIEAAVALARGSQTLYCFDLPALNTFSRELANERITSGKFKLIKQFEVDTYSLNELLDRYLPAGTQISFMNIDVEGKDEAVLRSNNWEKYAPAVLLVEHYNFRIEDLATLPIFLFLKEKGYSFAAKCFNTIIFQRVI